MMKTLKSVLAMSALIGVSACVSVLPDPDPSSVIYRLTSDTTRIEPAANAPVIRIDTNAGSRAINGRNIVVSPDARRLAVIGGAEWADSLPRMIQQNFLDVLGARSDLVGVVPIAGTRANYRVHLNIDNFEARFDQGEENPPLIIVAYTATCADSATRNLVGTKQVTQTMRASSTRVSDIVDMMDSSNRNALNDVANWLATLDLNG